MIEVLIFDSYGASGIPLSVIREFPEDIKNEMSKNTLRSCRTGKIVEFLKSIPIADMEAERMKEYVKEKGFVRAEEDRFYFKGESYLICCKIEKVDNSIPWTLNDYDGAESIKYLEFTKVDEKLNYWKQR